ncbi:hypothetical protein ABIA39_005868 [Nocardia sp. GAS34]
MPAAPWCCGHSIFETGVRRRTGYAAEGFPPEGAVTPSIGVSLITARRMLAGPANRFASAANPDIGERNSDPCRQPALSSR